VPDIALNMIQDASSEYVKMLLHTFLQMSNRWPSQQANVANGIGHNIDSSTPPSEQEQNGTISSSDHAPVSSIAPSVTGVKHEVQMSAENGDTMPPLETAPSPL